MFYAVLQKTQQLVSQPLPGEDHRYDCVIPSCHEPIECSITNQFVHDCQGTQDDYQRCLTCRQLIGHFYSHHALVVERYCFHVDREKNLLSRVEYDSKTHDIKLCDDTSRLILTTKTAIPYQTDIQVIACHGVVDRGDSNSPFHHVIRSSQEYKPGEPLVDISLFATNQKCAVCTKDDKKRLAKLRRPCVGACKKWFQKGDMTEIRDGDGISSFICKLCTEGRDMKELVMSYSKKRKVQKRLPGEDEALCPDCDYPIKKEQLERYHRCYRCNAKRREQLQQEEGDGDKSSGRGVTSSISGDKESSASEEPMVKFDSKPFVFEK